MRGAVTALALCALGGAAAADTPSPTATTATYGNWTVACAKAADGKDQCQMSQQLTLKGQDGQARPLLQWTIGTPPGANVARMILQVPSGVALRDGVTISLDKAAADAAPKPQEDLLSLSYLTCAGQVCVADADASDELFGRLRAVKTANVGFTLLQGAKKVLVPVSLDGFGDALAALTAAK